jgi:rubrerythrin
MDQKEQLNALEVALNNEMREREFYLKHARRSKNALGRRMFQQIGDDELEHYQRLKDLHQKWEKQQRWPESLPLKVGNTVVKEFWRTLEKVDEKSPSDADDPKPSVPPPI